MPEIDPTLPMPGSLPQGYQEVLYWKLTDKPARVIALQVLSLPLFVIFGLFFGVLALRLGELPMSLDFGLSEIGVLLGGVLLTFVLHELSHGVVMKIFGARPRYGVLWKQMMFYATTPGHAFRRNDYLAIALAPLFVLSLLVVAGMGILKGTFWVGALAVWGVINASGAIGDMWITMIVLRYSPIAYVIDERDGIRVFMPGP